MSLNSITILEQYRWEQCRKIISYKLLVCAFFSFVYSMSNKTKAKFESLMSRGMGKFPCNVRERNWKVAQGNFKKSRRRFLMMSFSGKHELHFKAALLIFLNLFILIWQQT